MVLCVQNKNKYEYFLTNMYDKRYGVVIRPITKMKLQEGCTLPIMNKTYCHFKAVSLKNIFIDIIFRFLSSLKNIAAET